SAATVVFDEGTHAALHAAIDAGLASESWRGERRPHLGTLTTAADAGGGTESGPVCAANRVAADGTDQWRTTPDGSYCPASLRRQLCRPLLARGISDLVAPSPPRREGSPRAHHRSGHEKARRGPGSRLGQSRTLGQTASVIAGLDTSGKIGRAP